MSTLLRFKSVLLLTSASCLKASRSTVRKWLLRREARHCVLRCSIHPTRTALSALRTVPSESLIPKSSSVVMASLRWLSVACRRLSTETNGFCVNNFMIFEGSIIGLPAIDVWGEPGFPLSCVCGEGKGGESKTSGEVVTVLVAPVMDRPIGKWGDCKEEWR